MILRLASEGQRQNQPAGRSFALRRRPIQTCQAHASGYGNSAWQRLCCDSEGSFQILSCFDRETAGAASKSCVIDGRPMRVR